MPNITDLSKRGHTKTNIDVGVAVSGKATNTLLTGATKKPPKNS